MSVSAHLALDLGAGSGRAIVGVLDRGRLTLHEVLRFPNEPLRLPSGLHWNITRLYDDVLEGIRRGLKWARERGLALHSLGVDTWGVDFGLLGASGELLLLPRCYRDERNQAAYQRVLAQLGREAIYDATGIQFMPLNTLYQLAATQAAEPGVLAQAETLLLMPDLVHYLLTGRRVCEETIASTTQMLDPRTRQWALPLLARLGLPARPLPAIVPAGTALGPLLPHVAEAVGAPDDLLVIVPAGHDTACAVAAVPARRRPQADAGRHDPPREWCYLSSGTWSLLGAELDRPCITSAALAGSFTNEAGLSGTTRFLKNITGLWLVQECRRTFESRGAHLDFEALTAAAEPAPPFRTLIDPDSAEFASPGDMPARIVAFASRTSQPAPETPGQFVRCCLESLAFAYRFTLQQLEAVLGRRFAVLHVVGGGGRNALLNQMTADATGREVVVGPEEATAAGNVLIQALGAGALRNTADLREVVAASFSPRTVQPRESEPWDGEYDRFLALRGADGRRGT